jgi:ADP-ribose pyrophosphatase YjhB (NUDIX family)
MVPRGAVAIVCVCARTMRIALVTRSKPPSRGIWSLPGGKVELGEPTMAAASRELSEECGLSSEDVRFALAPFTVTDVIVPAPGAAAAEPAPGSTFHYLLAQTFCRTRDAIEPSQLRAGDDAGDAQWCSLEELDALDAQQNLTPGVMSVVRRALLLHDAGLLPLEGEGDGEG